MCSLKDKQTVNYSSIKQKCTIRKVYKGSFVRKKTRASLCFFETLPRTSLHCQGVPRSAMINTIYNLKRGFNGVWASFTHLTGYGEISLMINKIASNSNKIMPTKTPGFITGKFHNSICLVFIFNLNFIALRRIQHL